MDSKDIKMKLDNNVGDYYANIVDYINALISEGNKEEAFTILKEELEQPYVPKQTMEALEKIFEEHFVQEALSRQLDIEEVREGLMQLNIAEIVPLFYTINLRMLLDEIEFYLKNSNDYVSCSMLILLLKDQGIDMDFQITKFGRTDFFNTVNIEIVDEELLIKYSELFEKEFSKNPSFVNYCMDILHYYLLVVFPFKFDFDFELYKEIVNYVNSLCGNEYHHINDDFRKIIEYEG